MASNPYARGPNPYANDGWAKTAQANIEYDNFNQRVDFVANRLGTNDQTSLDLTLPGNLGTPISDTNWRLRMRLTWPNFNAFRNTGGLFELGNNMDIVVGDSDFNSNTGQVNQKYIGMRVSNFDGNSPTFLIRAGGSPVPPNGFRGLMQGIVRDGASTTGTGNFTPGGQPGSQSTTHIELLRAGTMLVMTLYVDNTFTTMIEQKMMTIPPAVVGLKFLKVSNNDFANNPLNRNALIGGFMTSYEFLDGLSFTPIMPIFPNGLAAKIFNDLGINGPSTGDEVFARIFDDGVFPETWSRIREDHMYGFLENIGLIQRDIDKVTWDITTWSVI